MQAKTRAANRYLCPANARRKVCRERARRPPAKEMRREGGRTMIKLALTTAGREHVGNTTGNITLQPNGMLVLILRNGESC